MKPAVKYIGYALTLGVLALVFVLYGQPEFLVMVANQIWGCF